MRRGRATRVRLVIYRFTDVSKQLIPSKHSSSTRSRFTKLFFQLIRRSWAISLLMTSLFTFYQCLLSVIIFRRFRVIGVVRNPHLPYFTLYCTLPHILPFVTLHLTLPYFVPFLTVCLTLPYIFTLPYFLLYVLPFLTLPYLTSHLTPYFLPCILPYLA